MQSGADRIAPVAARGHFAPRGAGWAIPAAVAAMAMSLCGAAASVPRAAQAEPRANHGVGEAAAKRVRGTKRRVVLLGLRHRGRPSRFATLVSNPASEHYRQFLSMREYRERFAPRRRVRLRARRFLRSRPGVLRIDASTDRSMLLVVVTPRAGRALFCARGAAAPTGRLCRPRALRRALWALSAGEVYEAGGSSQQARAPASSGGRSGTPSGCPEAIATGAFTPNQLATAYEVDDLHARGLDGSGVRVATLSSQEVDADGFATWARCFGMAPPQVRQFAMPSATPDAGTAPEETVLDVEALAALAPDLERITPIFVPLDQSFPHSFLLFMFGALDRSRNGGRLPHVLSISDGVCESRFTGPQLRLGRRLLGQAAMLGITTLAASGDLGFRGCFVNRPGAMFPSSSPFTTSVGGTDLKLTAGNEIADQIVWSTYATDPDGVGSGGGPSAVWNRPGFQRAPGIGPQLQTGDPTRLAPDVAAMASFTPGLAVFDSGAGGWGLGGGTSAATPLTAAMVALALEQELGAGRPRLGSLPPLLYELARGPGYGSVFDDVTEGTSSQRPDTPAGQSPAGGAAQVGYDLATGLGSLRASGFAEAVAAIAVRRGGSR